jgi:hypothetical protein
MEGYITAANTYMNDTYDIAQNKDIASLDLWLDNYCKENTLKEFSDAMQNLVSEYYVTRIKAQQK